MVLCLEFSSPVQEQSDRYGLSLNSSELKALRVNPYAPIVPCHRVVALGGKKGGFSGHTSGMKCLIEFPIR